jgi:phage shock protein C
VNDRLYRSTTDRSLTGVAGGLAAYLGVDPSIVRVAWVVATIVTGGVAALVYLVMVFIVPEAPPGWTGRSSGPATWTAPPPAGWEAPDGGPEGGAPGWQEPTSSAWGAAPTGPAPAPVGRGNAGIVFGVILILLGAWFLLRQYIRVDWDLIWPVIVIGLGAVLIAGAMRRR